MATVLQCKDQWGRPVELTDERWQDHILPNHGELNGNLECIRTALVDPTCVMCDVDDDDGENFYRAFVLPPPNSQTYLKVCVSYKRTWRGKAQGFVKTAYSTTSVKQGETQKWPND